MAWTAWRRGNKSRLQNTRVVVEVTSRLVRMLVCRWPSAGGDVQACTVRWRAEATALRHSASWNDLAKTVQSLVVQQKLQGASVHVVLGSDLCVTRVLFGTKEEVQQELRALEERCSLYLSLGRGENMVAKASRALDARQQLLWVTIANRSVLRGVIGAMETAGLQVASLRPSLVSLSQCLAKLQLDQEGPVLLVEITDRGAEVGISYQGQLLLDYRPGGTSAKEHVAETLSRHVKRLQRYVDRRFPFAKGRLTKVFLCGEADDVRAVGAQFQRQSHWQVELLDAASVLNQLGLKTDATLSAAHAACAGGLLAAIDAHWSWHIPDFMNQWNSRPRGPLLSEALRAFWPVAAAAGVALAVFAAAVYRRVESVRLEQRLAAYTDSQNQWQQLQRQLTLARLTTDNLKQVRQHLFWPRFDELVQMLGQALPSGLWLDRVAVDGEGHLRLVGASHSEDGVFEFVRRLRQLPSLEEVALEGTQPASLPQGPAVRFDITARWNPFRTASTSDKAGTNAKIKQTNTTHPSATTGDQP
ncbi:MAG: hypothetical protein KatS3mg110_0761 [Pirellulaceae bacterium]|nr:MAG: hypothetical protein KatS3mg110_0761 [Pirellulaceae bacterium]